jgi:hypothetical protein
MPRRASMASRWAPSSSSRKRRLGGMVYTRANPGAPVPDSGRSHPQERGRPGPARSGRSAPGRIPGAPVSPGPGRLKPAWPYGPENPRAAPPVPTPGRRCPTAALSGRCPGPPCPRPAPRPPGLPMGPWPWAVQPHSTWAQGEEQGQASRCRPPLPGIISAKAWRENREWSPLGRR